MKNITLQKHSNSCFDYMLYNYYDVKGNFLGHIEAQFDNGIFNGIISNQTEDEFENIEVELITDLDIYNYIKEIAIKDYQYI